MKPHRFLLMVVMLMAQAYGFAGQGTVQSVPVSHAPATPVMVISYWGYVAFPPAMIVAFVVNGWVIRRKRII
jgi:hypothetical protein